MSDVEALDAGGSGNRLRRWCKERFLSHRRMVEWLNLYRCPVGNEEYPSNDFASGDMTSGDFPDDGIGGACLHEAVLFAMSLTPQEESAELENA